MERELRFKRKLYIIFLVGRACQESKQNGNACNKKPEVYTEQNAQVHGEPVLSGANLGSESIARLSELVQSVTAVCTLMIDTKR